MRAASLSGERNVTLRGERPALDCLNAQPAPEYLPAHHQVDYQGVEVHSGVREGPVRILSERLRGWNSPVISSRQNRGGEGGMRKIINTKFPY